MVGGGQSVWQGSNNQLYRYTRKQPAGNNRNCKKLATFRDSARLYRRHGYGFVTPALSVLAAHMPHVNFKVVSRALLHSRVSKRVTDFLWRLITGKLFMGEDAFTYLTRRSMVPHLRDKVLALNQAAHEQSSAPQTCAGSVSG
jgi:hypothetical protein